MCFYPGKSHSSSLPLPDPPAFLTAWIAALESARIRTPRSRGPFSSASAIPVTSPSQTVTPSPRYLPPLRVFHQRISGPSSGCLAIFPLTAVREYNSLMGLVYLCLDFVYLDLAHRGGSTSKLNLLYLTLFNIPSHEMTASESRIVVAAILLDRKSTRLNSSHVD